MRWTCASDDSDKNSASFIKYVFKTFYGCLGNGSTVQLHSFKKRHLMTPATFF